MHGEKTKPQTSLTAPVSEKLVAEMRFIQTVPSLFLPSCIYPSGVLSHPVCQRSLSKVGGSSEAITGSVVSLPSDHSGGDNRLLVS